jgi:hypothetical protein
MFLVIQHHHTVWANRKDVEPIDLTIRNEVVTLEFRATSAIGGTKRNFFADLLGKHVVLPFDQAGADPDDTFRPPRYQEFITGVDRQTGQPIRTSCGDDTREGGAHFLTPVFFDPDVLTRYREDNARYVLSRTRLWCLDLWGLDIDINDVGGEQLIQRLGVQLFRRAEPGEPGVVDQDVDVAGLFSQPQRLCGFAQVGADEPG